MSEHPWYRSVVEDFVECVRDSAPDMMQKVKVHLLLHLPDNLIDVGPPANYNTERYKHLLLNSHELSVLYKYVYTASVNYIIHYLFGLVVYISTFIVYIIVQLHMFKLCVMYNLYAAPCTCKCESLNSTLRGFTVCGNRQAPSRDIGKAFAAATVLHTLTNSNDADSQR